MQLDENGNIIVLTGGPMVHTVSYDEKLGILAKTTTGDDLRRLPKKDAYIEAMSINVLEHYLSFVALIFLLESQFQ